MTEFLRLLNPFDLILIAILLFFTVTGFLCGALGTLYRLFGQLAVLVGAVVAARLLAPVVAEKLVTPLVGKAFSEQAALAQANGLLPGLQQGATDAAAGMAQSLAFLILLFLFATVLGLVLSVAVKGLKLLTRVPPLGLIDSIGGAALGLLSGLALICAVLIGTYWFSPLTYTTLGFLSPERIGGTVLLSRLIEFLPIAI